MVAVIQIVVAGGLLLAWVWVLGRPLISGSHDRDPYDDLDIPFHERNGLVGTDLDRPVFDDIGVSVVRRALRSLFAPVRRWWRQPIVVRRRQMMLATIIASFVSFLLAVALRGLYVWLFAMMSTLLAAHLLMAAWVGAQITEARRTVQVARIKRRVGARAGGMEIRAPRATDLPGSELVVEPVLAASVVSDLIDEAWRSDHSLPDAAPDRPTAEPGAVRSRSRVSAPASVDTEPDAVVQTQAATDTEQPTEAASEAREAASSPEHPPPPATPPPHEEAAAADTTAAGTEPIFTRAAKDRRSRFRRKAKPIYIESQLDESDEIVPARAVNDG